MDEPTAHLDSTTEGIVQRGINDYAKHHLVLVIAHRLNTLKQAAHVVVLAGGNLVQQGSYQELSDVQGPFSQLITGGDEVNAAQQSDIND